MLSWQRDGLPKLKRSKCLPISGFCQRRRPTCQPTTSMYQPRTPLCQFLNSEIMIRKIKWAVISLTETVKTTRLPAWLSQALLNHILSLQLQALSKAFEPSTTTREHSMKRENTSGPKIEDWARVNRRTGHPWTCHTSGRSRPWCRECLNSKKKIRWMRSICYIGIPKLMLEVILLICSERYWIETVKR